MPSAPQQFLLICLWLVAHVDGEMNIPLQLWEKTLWFLAVKGELYLTSLGGCYIEKLQVKGILCQILEEVFPQ